MQSRRALLCLVVALCGAFVHAQVSTLSLSYDLANYADNLYNSVNYGQYPCDVSGTPYPYFAYTLNITTAMAYDFRVSTNYEGDLGFYITQNLPTNGSNLCSNLTLSLITGSSRAIPTIHTSFNFATPGIYYAVVHASYAGYDEMPFVFAVAANPMWTMLPGNGASRWNSSYSIDCSDAPTTYNDSYVMYKFTPTSNMSVDVLVATYDSNYVDVVVYECTGADVPVNPQYCNWTSSNTCTEKSKYITADDGDDYEYPNYNGGYGVVVGPVSVTTDKVYYVVFSAIEMLGSDTNASILVEATRTFINPAVYWNPPDKSLTTCTDSARNTSYVAYFVNTTMYGYTPRYFFVDDEWTQCDQSVVFYSSNNTGAVQCPSDNSYLGGQDSDDATPWLFYGNTTPIVTAIFNPYSDGGCDPGYKFRIYAESGAPMGYVFAPGGSTPSSSPSSSPSSTPSSTPSAPGSTPSSTPAAKAPATPSSASALVASAFVALMVAAALLL